MDISQAVLLAIVEGITEFLPVSSTGHMILVTDLLKIQQTEFVKSFIIIIQLGAILAVGVLYKKLLLENIRFWKTLLIAFLPSAVVGLTFYNLIKSFLLENTAITVMALILGGVILMLVEKIFRKANEIELTQIPYKTAFLIGLFQAVSVIPGVSRAGATIVGGMIMGVPRKTAVEFSFLLAVPTMLAATALDVFETRLAFSSNELFTLAVGFFFAFIVATLTVKYFLRFVEHRSLAVFGVYRIILGVLYLLFIF